MVEKKSETNLAPKINDFIGNEERFRDLSKRI